MADSPLLFFRLKQGKVWHVACGGSTIALCSEPLPDRSERQPKRPPYGGRVCPSCASVSAIIEVAISDAEHARQAQSVNTTTTTRLYEHDLTDPDGVLSDEEYSTRQVIEQGRIEALSLDRTNENPFPGAGEIRYQPVDGWDEGLPLPEELSDAEVRAVDEYGRGPTG